MRRARNGGPRTARVALLATREPSGDASVKTRKSLGGADDGAKISEGDLDAELQRAMADFAQLKEYYSDPCRLASTPRAASNEDAGPAKRGSRSAGRDDHTVASIGKGSPLDRLAVAEAVIRKLYRRNQELEGSARSDNQVEAEIQAAEARIGELTENLRVVNARNAALEASLRAARADLAEREQQATSLMHSVEMMGLENQRLSNAQRAAQAAKREEKRRAARIKDLEASLRQAEQQASFAQTQMESMRAAQALRVSGSKRDTQSLVDVLTRQLDAQAEQHRMERAAFNEKLGRLESENCALYVLTHGESALAGNLKS